MESEHALLQARERACTRCRLSVLRHGIVAAVQVGPDYTEGGIMLLSERPGWKEGLLGIPMVGKAGLLLNRLLYRAGLSRDEVVVSNRLRCRPPDDRIDDVPESLFACAPWTTEEFDTLRPGVVVLLGKVAMQPFFGPDILAGQGRRACRHIQNITYLGTYNPAHALRNKPVEALIVEDLTLAKELRDEAIH